MKATVIVKAIGLAYLFSTQGMATPAADDKALSFNERGASYDTANSALEKRQFIPIIQGIDGVLQYASETLAAQLEGAVTSLAELKVGCANGKALTSRLAAQGYNTTFIIDAICDASKQPALATNAEIQNKTLEASTRIWIVQALQAVGGRSNQLCNLIAVDGADSVGLNGAFVKQEICGVGG